MLPQNQYWEVLKTTINSPQGISTSAQVSQDHQSIVLLGEKYVIPDFVAEQNAKWLSQFAVATLLDIHFFANLQDYLWVECVIYIQLIPMGGESVHLTFESKELMMGFVSEYHSNGASSSSSDASKENNDDVELSITKDGLEAATEDNIHSISESSQKDVEVPKQQSDMVNSAEYLALIQRDFIPVSANKQPSSLISHDLVESLSAPAPCCLLQCADASFEDPLAESIAT
ncbi:hypothetical protein GH714_029785 [Hevea brasiliensis]|uniref:Uncharacterized protein n=1 Tax=Hevea brasiliensis TaxID=3981 RepID=A0A6A6NK20_HEVBR|nr:hypothetical protein GH714_029785 [Hevea brasiliensis]